MDPYSGMRFEDAERPAGMFFVDFGLGDTFGGFGPIIPFLGMAGLARYTGGAKAYSKMYSASQARGVRGRHFAGDLRGPRGSRSFVTHIQPGPYGPMSARRARIQAAGRRWSAEADILEADIRKFVGGPAPGRGGAKAGKVMAGLYDEGRRHGYDFFARYGNSAGAKVVAAGVTRNALRFLEGMALLTVGMELGRGLFQSIADWQPAQAVGPQVEFGDTGYASVPAAAMTQRRRAMAAIHNSQLGTRAALGNEASFVHG